MEMLKGKRILLIVTGGIAAFKSLELVRQIRSVGGEVRAILTKSAAEFVTPLSLQALTEDRVYSDLFSLTEESEMGHIQLSRNSDIILVAPATANFLAKMRLGICDDLASTVVLATDKPVIAVPAMNVRMWDHEATQENIITLKDRNIKFIGPNEGEMACGEYGLGRMSEPSEIVSGIQSILEQNQPLLGKTALVTAGPTREPIDPVRFIANRSSGKQGYAIAEALAAAGAETTLVTGPTNLPVPSGMRVLRIETADEMLAHCLESLPVDVAVCAAAVADWKVANKSEQKIKKQKNINHGNLLLNQNADILKTLSNADNNRPSLVIGFAAETEDILKNGIRKRKEKNCDWILANDVAMGTQTFGGDNNAIHFISQKGTEEWPIMKKEDVARYLAKKIIDEIGRV
tara:strand:+ start:1438 stop:2649 length:1212 start_codon:yes stop_codon:yes gene_type:complete